MAKDQTYASTCGWKDMTVERRKLLEAIAWVLAIATALTAFYFSDLHRYLSLEYVKTQREFALETFAAHPITFFSTFVFGFAVFITLAMPGAWVVMIAAGGIFGTWLGALGIALGASIGGTVTFLLSRFLLKDYVQKRWGAKLEKINREMERDGVFVLFSLRLMPIVPYLMINLLMALTPIRPHSFFLVSFSAMCITGAVYANAGTQLANVNSMGDVASPKLLIALAALGTFPWAMKALFALARSRRENRL